MVGKKKKKTNNNGIVAQVIIVLAVVALVIYGDFISDSIVLRLMACSFNALLITGLIRNTGRLYVFWLLLCVGSCIFWGVFLEYDLTTNKGFAIVKDIEPRDRHTYNVVLRVLDVPYEKQEAKFYIMNDEKNKFLKGDTLLVSYSLFSDGDLSGGVRNVSKKFDKIDKKRYLRPSYWYFTQFPEKCYNDFGYNLVYKATFDFHESALHFTDVCGKPRSIKYSPKNYADTFLVFRNINEEINDRFIVCAPEVNIPENWKKIFDYGYIFHYDVYSKEEIESQCPRIRNYVEKYKERMQGK